MEGQWVFGGVERGAKGKFFLVPVEKRDKQTLLNIIKERILPGTIIISDCFKSYDCLKDEDFIHLRVNHSVEFVCTEASGEVYQSNLQVLQGQALSVHTQGIESRWRNVRYSIPVMGTKKDHFQGYLSEYV